MIEEKLILSCVKIHPTAEELAVLNALIPQIQDWESLGKNITERGLGPLLLKKLPLLSNASLIPAELKNKLQQVYYRTLTRNMVLIDAFQKIMKAFGSEGISAIALKGIHLSEWLYEDIGLRQMSDLDLLIRREDAERCLQILTGLGYVPESEEQAKLDRKLEVVHYTPMVCNGVAVELHIKLHNNAERYSLNVDELWKNAQPHTLHQMKTYGLAPYDLLIYLCIHLDRHFQQGHVQFTCFSDIANLLEKFSDQLDWDIFIAKCLQYNCEKLVFGHLMLAHKYMHAKTPSNIAEKYKHAATTRNEGLLLKYLNGYRGFTSGMPKHIGNFKHLESFSDRLWYFFRILFPSKEFMVAKFKLQHPSLYAIYYPYRFWLGLKGIVLLIKRKME